MDFPQVLVMILMAVSLSAAAGLRAFLPLFAISLLSNTGHITLASSFQWLSSTEAVIVFGLAVVLEIAADKIPGLDNTLDGIGLVVKPLAAALLSTSLITGMDPLLAMVLGLIIGGSVAGTIHYGKAHLRAGSTMLTAGAGNPVLSLLEDGISIVGTTLGIWLPVLIGAFVLLGMWMLGRRIMRRHRRSVTATVHGPDGELITETDARSLS
ncbi:MAG: DUF4126 domain-containing protein [bacterium]|nr:DUF4126 domain-containing protein [bacterium]